MKRVVWAARMFFVLEAIGYIWLFFFLSSSFEFHQLLGHQTEQLLFLDEMTVFLRGDTSDVFADGLKIPAYITMAFLCICCVYRIVTARWMKHNACVDMALLVLFPVRSVCTAILIPIALYVMMDNRLYGIEILLSLVFAQIVITFITYIFAQTVQLCKGLVQKFE